MPRKNLSTPRGFEIAVFVACLAPAMSCPGWADETAATAVPQAAGRLSKDPPGMKRLAPQYDLWIDPVNKRVVVDGSIVLREGQLEMFACPKGTKEHEAVVALDSKAHLVHTALLAVGAQSGTPVQFTPDYQPATGTEVDVTAIWTDKNGVVHRDRAQDWVRNVKTGKAMEFSWVFAGSGFWKDPGSGQEHYMAESGDLICVSNFPSATLDLPVESSQATESLLYQAFTDHIPPIGTRVRVVLTPKLNKAKP
jgi:hypothetical protein